MMVKKPLLDFFFEAPGLGDDDVKFCSVEVVYEEMRRKLSNVV